MLEELEKHLIINSNRLRTFEDARLKIVTYVETKFGLRIRDSKPSETASRGYCDPTDVDAINSSASGEGKGSPSPRDGCFKCGGAHLQRDCNVDATPRKGNDKKGKQSKSWPKGSGKRKSKEGKGDGQSKGKSKGSQVANCSHKGKTSKTGFSSHENQKSERRSESQDDDGWCCEERNDDWSSVGWHQGWEQTYDNSACSLSLGSFDVEQFVAVCLVTASGECILVGGVWQFQGHDENGLCRSLNGRSFVYCWRTRV